MKFWDSSAVIPLLVFETTTESILKLFESDPVIVAWWATDIECTSAISRRQRSGELTEETAAEAFYRLNALRSGWHEVEPSEDVRETAKRLLRVHDLRTADALQLAAAFYVSEARPSSLEFVTLDSRLVTAARREGFLTIPGPS
jgi:predicted nucleic acid-binding protein